MDFSKYCDNLGIDRSIVDEASSFASEEMKKIMKERGIDEKDPLTGEGEYSEVMKEVYSRVEKRMKEKKEERPVCCSPKPTEDDEIEEGDPNSHPNELLWKLYTEGKWGTEKGKVYDETSNPELGRVEMNDIEWFMNQTGFVLRGKIHHTSPDGFYDADTTNEALSIITDTEKTEEILTRFAHYHRDMNQYCEKNNYKNRNEIGDLPEKIEKKWFRSPVANNSIIMALSPSDQKINPHAILDHTEDFTLAKHGVPKMCDSPGCCLMGHVMAFLAPQFMTAPPGHDPLDVIQWYMDIPVYSKDNREELCALCIYN